MHVVVCWGLLFNLIFYPVHRTKDDVDNSNNERERCWDSTMLALTHFVQFALQSILIGLGQCVHQALGEKCSRHGRSAGLLRREITAIITTTASPLIGLALSCVRFVVVASDRQANARICSSSCGICTRKLAENHKKRTLEEYVALSQHVLTLYHGGGSFRKDRVIQSAKLQPQLQSSNAIQRRT